jgi:iron complex transport system substrate-binding protein
MPRPVVVLSALVLAACAAPPTPARRAARVVSLAPSVTEAVFALGEGGRLVGVCGYCDHPPEVARLPRVGGYLAPSVELVLAARPDLVVVVPSPGNREAVRAIERAGVRVLVLRDRTLADLRAGIRALAATLGVPERGERLVADVDAGLATVRARVAGAPARRVLLVVGHRPLVVAGGGTLQDELLTIAGGANVAADAGTAWPAFSVEMVAARAPEVILDAAMGSEAGGRLLFRDLAGVPAVERGDVVALEPDVVFRAGPRIAEAAAVLAAAIHPGAGVAASAAGR